MALPCHHQRRALREQTVTVAHGYLQPRRSHQCVVNLSGRNSISDRGVPMEKECGVDHQISHSLDETNSGNCYSPSVSKHVVLRGHRVPHTRIVALTKLFKVCKNFEKIRRGVAFAAEPASPRDEPLVDVGRCRASAAGACPRYVRVVDYPTSIGLMRRANEPTTRSLTLTFETELRIALNSETVLRKMDQSDDLGVYRTGDRREAAIKLPNKDAGTAEGAAGEFVSYGSLGLPPPAVAFVKMLLR
ncbi:hypothetical protein EVAR_37539_1 [Eumeta japonica]|uniref:Uncharacterized protein n=1 Tax=Eumeta variegata TaxID=151549 RepID=A0A4C1XV29_EUMVA|nr:hypothetical protein EVAR_37539_1 [Eumeta japonica]